MTTSLPTAQWFADSGQWYITDDNATVELAYWAETQPELASVDLQLSANNCLCHWLELPGVKVRMLSKALPFALEDSLINDVDDYRIIQNGKSQNRYRAYIADQALLEALQQALELHHLQLRHLLPETAAIPDGNWAIFSNQGWLIKLDGRFEGWVSDDSLIPAMDSILHAGNNESITLDSMTIVSETLNQGQIVKSNLETSFFDQIGTIDITTDRPQIEELNLKSSLITASVQRQTSSVAKWWGGAATLAAMWLVLMVGNALIDNRILRDQISDVRQQSVALYKQWFPGERIRFLRRQFEEKLSGGTTVSSGFMPLMRDITKVYQQPDLQNKITLQSIRYSDRLSEITLEVTSTSMPALQQLKVSLEKNGLTADIAQATNDKGIIKGRLRIGGAA